MVLNRSQNTGCAFTAVVLFGDMYKISDRAVTIFTATVMELKSSAHKFAGVYTGSAHGRNTLWTRHCSSHADAGLIFDRSRTLTPSPMNANAMNLLIDEGSNCAVYREWDPRYCPLAAGVLSGLFHFPVGAGDIVFVLGASCSTLSHLADLVGSMGQIRAVMNESESHSFELRALKAMHANIWIKESRGALGEFDAVTEKEGLYRVKSELLKACDASGAASVFAKLSSDIEVRRRTLSKIFSFLGTFPVSPGLTSIIALYPTGIPPVTASSLGAYEQYLMRILQPLCTVPKPNGFSSGNLWITLSVPFTFLAPPTSDDGSDTDIICEHLFDVVGSCVNRLGSFRPKEQLRLDSQFFQNTVLLLSRCRKGAPKAIISADSNTRIIEQVLASLFPSEGPEISIDHALGAPPGFPTRVVPVDPQLAFDLQQAAQSRAPRAS